MYGVRSPNQMVRIKCRQCFKSISMMMLGVLLLHFRVLAQKVEKDTLSVWEKAPEYSAFRGKTLALGMGTVYIGGMSILYSTWYKNYPSEAFHFFDDSGEWQQMDKLGHVGSTYYLSRWSSGLIQWTGTNRKKAALIGTAVGFGFQLTVEIMDGFSSQWGFSTSDLMANTLGASLFLGQELVWSDQRITFKMSYHESEFAKYRPDVLGNTFSERLLKDYNGQTYWLSANIKSLFQLNDKFPAWLNFAFGYGAEGMIGANTNDVDAVENPPSNLVRYRQYYLAPDIDLTKIKTKSGVLKTLFEVFGFVKIPAPTIEFNSKGNVVLHGMYF